MNNFLLIIFIALILNLNLDVFIIYVIRSLRLHKICREFNLKYSFGDYPRFTFLKYPSYNRNLIIGSLGNHEIEFKDFLYPIVRGYAGDTILKIDGKFHNFYEENTFTRKVPIKLIRKKFVELQSEIAN